MCCEGFAQCHCSDVGKFRQGSNNCKVEQDEPWRSTSSFDRCHKRNKSEVSTSELKCYILQSLEHYTDTESCCPCFTESPLAARISHLACEMPCEQCRHVFCYRFLEDFRSELPICPVKQRELAYSNRQLLFKGWETSAPRMVTPERLL